MTFSELQTRFDRLRSNKIFETFIIVIIIASALNVGAHTFDFSAQQSSILFGLSWGNILNYLDVLITIIFVIEITIRFLGEKNKLDFFKQGWNWFDLIIVIVSLLPLENGDTALVARLVRVFRVLRMISIIPELRLLLNSLLRAMSPLGYIVLLMFVIFYIYAAVGTTFFHDINEDLWGDISISMLTLFRVMTFEDWTDVMYQTMANGHSWSWIYYLSFIFFTTFAFLNMVIGVVVNTLENETKKEQHETLSAPATEGQVLELQEEIATLRNDIRELVSMTRK